MMKALIFFILTGIVVHSSQNKSLILLVDLRRESDCNHIENYVPQTEVNEIARQRAEAVQWALQRLEETASSEATTSDLRIVDTCGSPSLTCGRILSLAAEYNLINYVSGSTNEATTPSPSQLVEKNFCQNLPQGKGFLLFSSFLQGAVVRDLKAAGASPPLLNGLYWPAPEALFEEQGALLAMVKRLRWKFLVLVLDLQQSPEDIQEAFNKAAAQEDICVIANFIINSNKYNNAQKIREDLAAFKGHNVVLISPQPASVILDLFSNDTLLSNKGAKNATWIVSSPDSIQTSLISKANQGPHQLYIMENEFLRVPEFMEDYRNMSSHTSKSWEDPSLMHLLRSLLGLVDHKGQDFCNFSLPSEAKVRDVLGITWQERQIRAKLLANGADQEMVNIGYFATRGGLQLRPLYQDAILPGQVLETTV